MDLGFNGKTALVTGASQGIGAAIAECLAREGCHLVLAARQLAPLQALADKLEQQHGISVRCVVVDLAQPLGCERLMQQAGAIDILVNNAGAVPVGTLESVVGDAMHSAMELKLLGYKRLSELAFAAMRKAGHGVILNVIGTAGERARAQYALGSMVNAALVAMTRALGLQGAACGVRVVGLHPGATLTERKRQQLRQRALAEWGDAELWHRLAANYPFGRLAAPTEIAACAAFLCSSAASYVNAVCLTADGGTVDSML